MPRWCISRRGDGHLELLIYRVGTLGVFRAGAMHASTNLDDVLRWIVEQDAAAIGDIITLPDGGALQLLRPAPGKS
jgi:hypothetical protein